MNPFFSVIIPSYNRAGFIKKTIESVQAQVFENWECIVVDDGSVDNTKEIVEELGLTDSRVKYIYQDNAERSAARNTGIKNAKGIYVCFLDSDDAYMENHLVSLFEEIESKKNPIGLFFTNYRLCENGLFIEQIFPVLDQDVLTYLFYNPIIPARVCIHREILKKELFDEEIVIVEDLLLWIRIALNFPLFHLQKETVIYNVHANNSINVKNNAALKRLNGIHLFLKKYPFIKKQIPGKMWNDVIGDTHFNIMKYYLFKKSKISAIKHLLLSIYFQKKHAQLKHKINILIKIVLRRKIDEYEVSD